MDESGNEMKKKARTGRNKRR